MWRYKIATGEMVQVLGTGYSGFEEAKNQPDLVGVKNRGPIPPGAYAIGPAFADPEKGPIVMGLGPKPGTDTLGRGGFLIHGDSIHAPGTASHGCIILSHDMREEIANSGDTDLEVVP